MMARWQKRWGKMMPAHSKVKLKFPLRERSVFVQPFKNVYQALYYYEFWCMSLFPTYFPHTNHETVIIPLTSVAASSSPLCQINPQEEIPIEMLGPVWPLYINISVTVTGTWRLVLQRWLTLYSLGGETVPRVLFLSLVKFFLWQWKALPVLR